MAPFIFSSKTFQGICDRLCADDPDLARVVTKHGYPPMWSRPNSFETLVHIILEQQVSLASAKAALEKLRSRVGIIDPESVISLSDEAMRACYVSRQKTAYIRNLGVALSKSELDLNRLESLSDDDVRRTLTRLNGIGNWTADIYLIMVLKRADIFPIGDLAAVNALKRLKGVTKESPVSLIEAITNTWQPYRSVAAMILWHYYLSSRNANNQDIKLKSSE